MPRLALVAALSFSTACTAQEIIHLPAGFRPAAISGDGRVVGGSTYPSTSHARTWTQADGVQPLANTQDPASTIWGLNQDGSVAVGSVLLPGHRGLPYRWTAAGGILALTSDLPIPSTAYGVSDDGAVVGGNQFLWTLAGGAALLPSNSTQDGPCGVSGDGRFAMGYQNGDLYRWTVDSMQSERIAMGGSFGSAQLNHAGDAAAGTTSRPQTTGFLWSPGRYRVIPEASLLYDISADGRVAVGRLAAGGPCIITPGLGVANLVTYLNDTFGLTLPITFGSAVGLSDDGRTIVIGAGPGNADGWLLRLPPARPGDFNLDEIVDYQDYIDYIDCFTGVGDIPPSAADLNHDGFVDWFDFDQFLAEFGG